MKPILYGTNEFEFTSNGLGRLSDCISCQVTEERNGIYELEFEYPATGTRFDQIQAGMIVAVSHDATGDIQPFDIVGYTKPINGIVTFRAVHISYRLNNIINVSQGVFRNITTAFNRLNNTAKGTPFVFSADFSKTGIATCCESGIPISLKAMMGGVDGSILDAYGGEWEFDLFSCRLKQSRGSRSPLVIRYGKNLIDFTEDTDFSETFNCCYAYWSADEPEIAWAKSGLPTFDGRDRVVALDLSDKYDSRPTTLESDAIAYMRNNQTNLPQQSITVDFEQYGSDSVFGDLSICKLCDTVGIEYPQYGLSGTMKVVKTVWDPLQERYSEIELGSLQTTLKSALFGGNNV